MGETVPTVKKTTRIKKTSTVTPQITESSANTSPAKISAVISAIFTEISLKIVDIKTEFENLIKQIAETKESWTKEQKDHYEEFAKRREQEDIERKREQETYNYTTALARKRAEDEFADKKLQWEKDLAARKQELADQQKELEDLRKTAADFDNQKDQAVKTAQNLLQQSITQQFEIEKKLREQEFKSEKEILNLKNTSLTAENNRLTSELTALKKSLEESTQQIKEVAIKIIEARNNQTKDQISSENLRNP